MKNPKNIVITGASSGLGAALARHYAAPGVTLHLQGRHTERLAQIATMCQEREATVYFRCVDVTDAESMQNWLMAADNISPIDLIIANAGISAGTGGAGEDAAQVRRIFATNVDGVINSIQPLLPAMVARGYGQIAVMSSLAGLRALPSCPAYSASKAAVRYYGDALRGVVSKSGIGVSIICPGYIKTPMTEVNNFPMPFIMDADKAASLIALGLAAGKPRIAFPKRIYIPLWLISCFSPTLTDWFFARLPNKPSL